MSVISILEDEVVISPAATVRVISEPMALRVTPVSPERSMVLLPVPLSTKEKPITSPFWRTVDTLDPWRISSCSRNSPVTLETMMVLRVEPSSTTAVAPEVSPVIRSPTTQGVATSTRPSTGISVKNCELMTPIL